MRKLIVFLWIGCAAVLTAAENIIPKHGPLAAAPSDTVIARIVTQLLENSHYLQQPFDDTISSRFLDRYINLLDPQHLHFFQSDLADFEPRRTKLDDQIKKFGDTSAAYEIANVFIERMEARVAFCQDLLKNEKLEFNSSEKVLIDRKDAPFPKDLDEAKLLWRDRVRAEVLQEVINQNKPTNQIAGASSPGSPGGEFKVTESTRAKTTTPARVPASIPADVGDAKVTVSASNVPPTISELETDAPAFAKAPTTPVEIVSHRYNRILRIYREWDNEDALEVFLTALARSYDPHSDYLGKSQLDNFSITMSLSLFGIGARLTSEDGYCTIVNLTDGGPAMRSGKLKPKDRIVAVAQGDGECVDVVDMKLNRIVEMIRGPKGTEVKLTIIPVDATSASTRRVISLVREEIKLEESEAKGKLIELPGADKQPIRLGVIDLPSFYHEMDLGTRRRSPEDGESSPPKSTSVDVAKLLRKFRDEKVQGVILDLRRNGGGSLEEAVKVSGLFIKDGPVVQVRDPDGKVGVELDTDETVAYDGPLLVLTSHFSASASEILAGALQDYGRAVIVGDSSTHGKGTVQALHELDRYVRMLASRQLAARLTNNPGALKFTIRKFYRASGVSTQLKGVTPDIILPSVVDAIEVGEGSLENPLLFDTNAPAKFTPINLVTPYLAELQRRSAERVATAKDFAYIREDYELMRKVREDKTISLSLAERLKEKEEAEKRKQDRKTERLARAKSPETAYEITLKLADQPGLPDPIGKTNQVKLASGVVAAPEATSGAAASNTRPPHPLAKIEEEEDDGDEATATIDVPLEEAKHILLDYFSLAAAKGNGVVQAQVPPTASTAR